jgi:hypothetical protein
MKIPLHKLNFLIKLKKKKNGKLIKTQTLINEGKTAKSLAPETYSFQGK